MLVGVLGVELGEETPSLVGDETSMRVECGNLVAGRILRRSSAVVSPLTPLRASGQPTYAAVIDG